MKKCIGYCILFLLFATPCLARDFIVQFLEENYKETRSPFSYLPVIYHSFQVTSTAGPKILILNGDDYHYRSWIRQYVAKGKAFVVKVPDDQADLFITASAFEIDITDIHPMNLARYRESELENQTDPDRYAPEKTVYGSGGSDSSDIQNQRIEQLKMDRENQIQKARADQQAGEKKALENRQREQQAQKQRLEKEQAQRFAAQELEQKKARQEAVERERLDQARLNAQLAAQRAVEEEQRQQELELRWQELKKRLLEDENIRRLDQAEREQELNRRWLELRQRLNI